MRSTLLPVGLVVLAGCGGRLGGVDSGLGGGADAAADAANDAGGSPDSGGLSGSDAGSNPADCDTTLQDCVDPVISKCTVIYNGSAFETECVTPSGMQMEGVLCMRAAAGNTGVGHDDCATGLFCAALGLPAPELRCRRFCDTDAMCMTAGERCYGFDGPGPLAGFCVPTCTLFDAAGCPSGMSCSLFLDNDEVASIGVCRPLGALPTGSGCTVPADCGANMNCAAGGLGEVCTALCDSTHACAAGTVCNPQTGVPNGGGLCL
jgi:hypothetical protein